MGRIRTDLVEKALPYIDGKEGEISLGSSRMKCYNGKLYSYGSHYPLLFRVGPLLFVNESGYSATTNMHISAARSYADHAVKLEGTDTSAENVLESLRNEKEHIARVHSALKRQNTKKAKAMYDKAEEITKAIEAVKAVMA